MRDHARHRLLRAAALELVADRLRPAPHLLDLDAPGAQLAQRELALDAGLVEELQRAVDRRRRSGVAEAVGDEQPPVPVVLGVGLGVGRDEVRRRVDVAALVGDPQVELEVGPVVGQRVDDLRELLREGHGGQASRWTRAAHAPGAILASMVTLTDDLVTDYRVLTDGCGLLDRSERGKLALTGSGAREFLAGQVTNDIVRLRDGGGCYAAFLTPKGKMLGDLRVLAVGEPDPELLLDTDRPTLQALFDMIRRFKIGYDVELHKRTLERGLLSLAGPAARRVAGAEDLPEEEHAHAAGEIGGRPVRLVATDVGIDVLCDAADTEAVRAALLHAGAEPVSEDAAEILRVERGRPRYGAELDDSTIPQEAGLNERAVSFTKGCYVGQETVARLFYRGKPNRHLRGLRLSEPVASGAELRLGERVVGRLASSLVSPAYGPIALALVRREASVGDTVDVEGGASAEVVDLPFA